MPGRPRGDGGIRIDDTPPLDDAIVVGLPRGGVIVGAAVARVLGLPLDVIIVQKIGHPDQAEFGIGALGEHRVRVIDDTAVRSLGIPAGLLAQAEERATTELARRVRRFRNGTSPAVLGDRHVLLVDDGIATGASAAAACRVARAANAHRITLAVPVAPRGWESRFADLADAVIAVDTPRSFGSVGRFYKDFAQTTDTEVLDALAGAARRTDP